MIEKIKIIVKNKIAVLPILGAVLILISLFTPFAISMGLEGISISSQSNVWYWGFYEGQDQLLLLNIPFMLNIFLPMIVAVLAILMLILSIEFGLNEIKRKLYGELLFIFIVLIYLSITLTVRLIEYSFSLMPDLEYVFFPTSGIYHSFWRYRLTGFGPLGINIAILLGIVGSFISLLESRKSFFYIEITVSVIWIIFFLLLGSFL